MLTDLFRAGAELVDKCSKVQWWNFNAKVYYSTKLEEFNDNLANFLPTNGQALMLRYIMRIRAGSGETQSNVVLGPCRAPETPSFTVGLDVPLLELRRRLLKDDVPAVVVLSAAGGSGKTTLAKKLCHDDEIKGKFKDNILFVTFSEKPNIKVIVQNMLQHKSFPVPEFQNDEHAINQLGNLLMEIGTVPLLLVLDDVWPQSESLMRKFMLPIPGYKILVTSRSEFPGLGSTYKLEKLSDQDAMTLFCHSAFQDGRMNMPDELVREIVEGCRKLPLALIVFGRSLCGQPEETWRCTQMQLSEGLLIDPNGDLLTCFKPSIDALEGMHYVKECFLDLGSFPEDQRIPATALLDMWVELYNLDDGGVHALANIHELASRNLVNLVFSEKMQVGFDGYYNEHFVTQHDVLRYLAIRQSSQEPKEQRKRLIMDVRGNDPPEWSMPFHARLLSISTICADETFSSSSNNMLLPEQTFSSIWYPFSNLYKSLLYRKKCKHLPEVEVLILNFRTKNYSLPKFMEEMDQLKVLIITNYGLYPAELSNIQLLGLLSSLKRIRLEHVSISFLTESRLQYRNLLKISLGMCKIGETFRNCAFDFAHVFPNLVEIDIHCCNDLVELPEGLCDIICLKKLSITKCNDLDALPQRLGRLTNLEVLRLRSCTGLVGLPDSVGNLHKLRFLDISDCLYISKLPDSVGDLCNLKKLDMRGCELRQLPPSVKDLGQLKDVICDEDMVDLWEPFKIHLNNLTISVLKEYKNLNWLPSLHH